MKYWIKERHNPQLGTYFVANGQLSEKEARVREQSLYGFNVMHGFDTEAAYQAFLEDLKQRGERVQ